MRCRCGSTKTETDGPSGTIVCVGCGEVLEENTIVSEITFQEISGGKTVLSGSFAGDSGRHKIARLAYALHLPERYREAAQRYYNLAVINRFTRGRKSEHVAAANVFVLGSTFLKLVRTLNLKLPLIDPSIYISRFAAALDFGEFTQRVAHDAVRLVQRMDRDWIRTGRRPAGICGACLLMAARMNGFRRTTKEMIYIVKVAEITIHSRLKEFKQTESANLSVRDFRNLWLENEADPPAFSKARKELEAAKKRAEKGPDDGDELAFDEEEDGNDDEQYQIDSDLDSVVSRRRPTVVAASPGGQTVISYDDKSIASTPAANALSPEDTQSTMGIRDDTQSTLVNREGTQSTLVNGGDAQPGVANSSFEHEAKKLADEMDEWMHDSSFLKESEAYEKENAAIEAAKQAEADDTNLSDVDDEEIEAMILTPQEVKVKTTIWYNANKDYLEEMKARMMKIEMDKRNGIFVRKGKGSKKRKFAPASTPTEAAKQLLTSKKFSKKINQAVFDGMFESPENIEKMKEMDKFKEVMRQAGVSEDSIGYAGYEVVEESGDTPSSKKQKTSDDPGKENVPAKDDDEADEDDDDEDMELDDMADDERMMLEGRRRMGWTEMEADDDYYDYDDD
ncbi:hypothetical protein BJV82DRAFT_645506 [Fennellomyces sp. T-0311]|nr:hypothetical protein BJV82DRAFT_645506 [Fennellomyces sp. T-0311]